ncbi:hypothetical protein LA080_004205 [Diaporthe eres]|nr:hypothetical protein LA080_004205 [Diaporthe eres]
MPIEVLAAIGTTVSVLNGTFALGKQFFDLYTAPDEIRTAIEQLALVQGQLQYARDLRDQRFPDKTSPEFGTNTRLIQSQIAIKSVADGIRRCEGMLVAVDDKGLAKKAAKDSVPVVDRFKWVMGNKVGFRDLYLMLTNPLLMLLQSINFLENLPHGDGAPPRYRESTPIDESFLSPMQRWSGRGKSVDLPRGGVKGIVTSSRTAKLDDDGVVQRASSLPPNDTSPKPPQRARKKTLIAVDPPNHKSRRSCELAEANEIYIERVKRQRQGSR